MLNRSGERGHLCLVPVFRGNTFSFFPFRMMLALGLMYITFIILRYIPPIPSFSSVLNMNGCSILSNAISGSIEIIV